MLDNKQELGLNPEQEKKLRELRANFEKESVQIGAQVRMTEIDLDLLLEQDKWDLGGIEPKVRQIANLQGELRLRRLKTLEAGRATLSPEQLEKFKQIGHRMRAMGGPGRAMGPAGPMGPTQPRGPGGSMPPGQPMGPGMPGPGSPPAPRY
jgi:Spy/CpxP family protein refolding chaperone